MNRLKLSEMRTGKRYEFIKYSDGCINACTKNGDTSARGEDCYDRKDRKYILKNTYIDLSNGYTLDNVDITFVDFTVGTILFTAVLRKF